MAGYAKLATFMTEKCYHVFRKYNQLAVRDLLYLQAELRYLEIEYASVSKGDAVKQDERSVYDRNWWLLQSSQDRGLDGEQCEKAKEIRVKLKEYCTFNCAPCPSKLSSLSFTDTSILRYEHVASLTPPKKHERSILQTWINSPTSGGGCGFLGRDLGSVPEYGSVYDEAYEVVHIMLNPNHGEDDVFSKLMLGPLLTLFHLLWRYVKASMKDISERWIILLTL